MSELSERVTEMKEYLTGIYEGELLKGIPNGQGKFVAYIGFVCSGEYKDGELNGFGEEKRMDGKKYVGMFKNGKYDGKGKFIWPSGA